MTPIVNGLADEFAGDVNVARLNANEANSLRLQERYGVRGHPSFVILDGDGAVSERFFGPQPAATLRTAMTAVAAP